MARPTRCPRPAWAALTKSQGLRGLTEMLIFSRVWSLEAWGQGTVGSGSRGGTLFLACRWATFWLCPHTAFPGCVQRGEGDGGREGQAGREGRRKRRRDAEHQPALPLRTRPLLMGPHHEAPPS